MCVVADASPDELQRFALYAFYAIYRIDCEMATRVDHERARNLLRRSGLNDREIAERIGVNQSTVWRLRNGKISNVSRYLDRLESLSHGGISESGLQELVELSKHSAGLRSVLESLLRFMQEDAMASTDP